MGQDAYPSLYGKASLHSLARNHGLRDGAWWGQRRYRLTASESDALPPIARAVRRDGLLAAEGDFLRSAVIARCAS